jgi:transposase
VLNVVWSRDLPAEPSSVRISRDGLGHWYASFVVPAWAQPLDATGRAIGVDWDVGEIATTTSDREVGWSWKVSRARILAPMAGSVQHSRHI